MERALAFALTVLLAALPCGAAATKRHTAKQSISGSSKKTPAVATRHIATTRPGVTHLGSPYLSARGRRHTKPSGPALQAHPDPDRYQQIQQALADRGYYKGEVNGQWNADSVDALKRFQTDQKLAPDGKISSLSLIGLGLGPKHEGSAFASTAPPASVSPTPQPSVPATAVQTPVAAPNNLSN